MSLRCDVLVRSADFDAGRQAGWAQPEARWHLVQGRSQTEGVPPISTVVAHQHVLMSSTPQLMSLRCDVLVRSADFDAGRQAGWAQPEARWHSKGVVRQVSVVVKAGLCGSQSMSLWLVKACLCGWSAGLCGSQSMSLWLVKAGLCGWSAGLCGSQSRSLWLVCRSLW